MSVSTLKRERVVLLKEEVLEVQTKEQSEELRAYVREVPQVTADYSCSAVGRMFERQPELDCIVVIDSQHKSIGLVMRQRFVRLTSRRFGRELYDRKSITRLMDEEPLVMDEQAASMVLIAAALGRTEDKLYDAVILQSKGVCKGVVSVADLLRLSQKLQLEAVKEQRKNVYQAQSMVAEIERAISQVQDAALRGDLASGSMLESTIAGKQELQAVTQSLATMLVHTGLQEEQMTKLADEVAAVETTTHFIKELSEQSSLLAMNASIEAAHAGVHGKGFAVVAGEMRNLAQRTKQAAEAVQIVLKGMHLAMDKASQAVQQGRQQSITSEQQVTAASRIFEQILEQATNSRSSSAKITNLSVQALGHSTSVRENMNVILERV